MNKAFVSALVSSFHASFRKLNADRRGSTAVMFALALPALIVAAGASLDYANLATQKAKLQAIADAAALGAAKELRLANSNTTTVTQNAQNYVTAAAPGATISFSSSIPTDKSSLTVNLSQNIPTYVMQMANVAFGTISASATAKIVGGQPLCVIGLDDLAFFAIGLDQSAKLNAPGCTVYSNSKNPLGLFTRSNAVMTSAFVCTAGGFDITGAGSITPKPLTDCPIIPDPLSSRAAPAYSGCSFTNLVVNGGSTMLYPGVYCGGLTLTGGANVTFASGVYVFQNGPLFVTGGASLQGTDVGLFFTGTGAVTNFDTASTISLSAPSSGPLAGILIFEDRNSPGLQLHKILSDNARTLLGTIYVPRGIFYVGSNSPIADQSAYTIIVARIFWLSAGPTMVLNTNYSSTNVPVPDNVGPNASRAYLTN